MKIKKIKSKEKEKKKTKKKHSFWLTIFGIILSLAIIAILAVAGAIAYIIISAPEFNPDNLYEKESTVIYDKDNNVITYLGINTENGNIEKREKVGYDDLPEVLVDAIIATEDSRFFQHNGFDLLRFIKASFGQLLGRNSGGASTITMQVSKNSFTSLDATGIKGIIRKFTDIYLSIFKIEKNYTKENILEYYVNAPFLGSEAYGVQQASKTYFGKDVKDLTLTEAAIIAGLFQAPTSYDPYYYPENTASRRSQVLYLMRLHGYITKEEEELANSIDVKSLLVSEEAPSQIHEYQGFIDTVVAEVKERTLLDPYAVPMIIYTTMDRTKQDAINYVYNNAPLHEKAQLAFSVLNNNDGAILAVGAGRNKTRALSFNYATQIKRHIGSSAKPIFVYGPGMEYESWSTYHPCFDEPEVRYSNNTNIKNADGKNSGFITLRYALTQSKNTCALQGFQSLNNEDILDFVTKLRITPEISNGMLHEAHSVGAFSGSNPVSMSAAYAAFGNGGYYVEPHSFTKIVYIETNEEYKTELVKEKVMSAQTAYMISNTLLGISIMSPRINGLDVASKTGTSTYDVSALRDKGLSAYSGVIRDSWLVSYSPDYTIANWYGYDELYKDYNMTMTTAGADRRVYMNMLYSKIFDVKSKFKAPTGVVASKVEMETIPAMLPSEFTPADKVQTHYFIKGTEPTETSDRYSKLNNPSNLAVSQYGNVLNVSWTSAATPNAVNEEYLTTYFEEGYEEFASKYLQKRLTYNANSIGTFGVDVYLKNNDKLTYVGFTNASSYTINLSQYSETYDTVVIKSAYSIFKNNSSDGISYKLESSSTPSVSINAYLPDVELVSNQDWTGSTIRDMYLIVSGNRTSNFEGTLKLNSIKNENGTEILVSDLTKLPGKYKLQYKANVVYLGNSYNSITVTQNVTVN